MLPKYTGKHAATPIPCRVVINSCPIPDYDPRFYSHRGPENALVSRWHLQAIRDPRYDFAPDQKEQWEQHVQFNNALEELITMHNLKEVELHFTSNCGWRIHKHDGEYEAAEYRESLLKRLFKALKQRRVRELPAIRILSIHNLQNRPVQLTQSYDFRDVLHDVDHFAVLIVEEVDSQTMDHDFDHINRRTFMSELQNNWLQPLQARLKSLSLAFHDCWGSLPGYFDGKDLRFPMLQSLTLREYCLGHDDSIDWVTNQTSLKSLRLISCRIVSHVRLMNNDLRNWNPQTHDWVKMPHGAYGFDGGEVVFRYYGTWEAVFDKVRQQLPLLTNLHIDYVVYRNMFREEVIDTSGVTLSKHRYTAFNALLLPSPWFPTRQDGITSFGNGVEQDVLGLTERRPLSRSVINPARDNEEGDRRGLMRLVESVEGRGGRCQLGAVAAPVAES